LSAAKNLVELAVGRLGGDRVGRSIIQPGRSRVDDARSAALGHLGMPLAPLQWRGLKMVPTEIIPVTELTDTELDTVCGGLLNNLNIATTLNITPQINVGVPIGTVVGGVVAGAFAAIGQLLGQAFASASAIAASGSG
jgi:hypothetical protein